ncbi:MAG TPA: peptidase C39 [Gammaproteobacteria bacterium]|nr:peptidase C39 [Gammaproteobacteria bacterium]
MSIFLAFIILLWQMTATIDEPATDQVAQVSFSPNDFQSEVDFEVVPQKEFVFFRVARQTYDFSCGSAALTTVLNEYLRHPFTELQVMEGLLEYGEAENIAERRAFSLLDMKRFLSAIGYNSAGFKGELKDLIEINRPVIVPIEYAGFKHFVVIKYAGDGRFFIADPAFGNISFRYEQFAEIWADNVLFIVYPKSEPATAESIGFELSEYDLRYISEQELRDLRNMEFVDSPLSSQQFVRSLNATSKILELK